MVARMGGRVLRSLAVATNATPPPRFHALLPRFPAIYSTANPHNFSPLQHCAGHLKDCDRELVSNAEFVAAAGAPSRERAGVEDREQFWRLTAAGEEGNHVGRRKRSKRRRRLSLSCFLPSLPRNGA